jgi:hypothetical protein
MEATATPRRKIKPRTVKGKLVCSTVWDGRGRAHILSPTALETVCGRKLEQAGKVSGKSCKSCSDGAAAANQVLRKTALGLYK